MPAEVLLDGETVMSDRYAEVTGAPLPHFWLQAKHISHPDVQTLADCDYLGQIA